MPKEKASRSKGPPRSRSERPSVGEEGNAPLTNLPEVLIFEKMQSRETRWKTRPGRIIGRLTILGLLCVNTRVLSSVGYCSCATGGTFMGMLLLGKCADPTVYIHR